VDVVVGLGSNLGDRLGVMREAVRRIDLLPSARITARSRVYETAPVGGVAQGPFLNAAVTVAWDAEPSALMAALLEVERELGRVRDVRWGPRTIDLDVLWIDGLVVTEPSLVVPHPALHERAFALAPLLDVAPEAWDPRSGARYVVPVGPSDDLEVRADLSL
jgi:2-amino-4-hydroxy-6-hydroxymethyldihydropteridine diphosphokinase